MKIVSYNVNGIRAAVKKGLLDWISEYDFDIICLQETKAQDAQIPQKDFKELGYKVYHEEAIKKGYSGVAILSKIQPNSVHHGMLNEKYDSEGRVITAAFDNFTLVNTYFPSGSSREERHEFKMEFLHDYQLYINELKQKSKPLIVVGDYNIVHTRQDIHNPDRKDNPSGYRPEEREWMTQWLEGGMVDAYRYLHPDTADVFSWWSYRAGSRKKNKGWRIDYLCVAKELEAYIEDAYYMNEATHSDHCPALLEIDL